MRLGFSHLYDGGVALWNACWTLFLLLVCSGGSQDVWVYDMVHDEWSKAAPMLIARYGHGSAELEHCVYAVGGHTAIPGVYPASPSVSLKQVALCFLKRLTVIRCR